MRIAIVPKTGQGFSFLLRRLRFSFGSGFFGGAMLILALKFFEDDFEKRESWLLSVLLLVITAANAYIGWRSHKSDCDDLAQLIAQQEAAQSETDTP